jgi:hypothetical protein
VPVPNTPDQAQAFARGQRLANDLWVAPSDLAAHEESIEAAYREAELAEDWSLRGWFSNGWDQRWDRLTALHERSHHA